MVFTDYVNMILSNGKYSIAEKEAILAKASKMEETTAFLETMQNSNTDENYDTTLTKFNEWKGYYEEIKTALKLESNSKYDNGLQFYLLPLTAQKGYILNNNGKVVNYVGVEVKIELTDIAQDDSNKPVFITEKTIGIWTKRSVGGVDGKSSRALSYTRQEQPVSLLQETMNKLEANVPNLKLKPNELAQKHLLPLMYDEVETLDANMVKGCKRLQALQHNSKVLKRVMAKTQQKYEISVNGKFIDRLLHGYSGAAFKNTAKIEAEHNMDLIGIAYATRFVRRSYQNVFAKNGTLDHKCNVINQEQVIAARQRVFQ